jgi:hypothetical protein
LDKDWFYLTLVISLLIVLVYFLYRAVLWSKKVPKGAFVFVAILPLMSIFPIPPQEIAKIERIKQQQVEEDEESGDDVDKNV